MVRTYIILKTLPSFKRVKDVVAIDPHEGRGRRELPKRVGRLYVL